MVAHWCGFYWNYFPLTDPFDLRIHYQNALPRVDLNFPNSPQWCSRKWDSRGRENTLHRRNWEQNFIGTYVKRTIWSEGKSRHFFFLRADRLKQPIRVGCLCSQNAAVSFRKIGKIDTIPDELFNPSARHKNQKRFEKFAPPHHGLTLSFIYF